MGLRHTCNNIVRVLSKQSPLHREGALLSRFVYKYDKKFRNDIGYRNIRKTHSTLRKYLQLNLLKDVENFAAVLPDDGDDFMPTQQMLQYLLSRIISFSMLMLRIYVCSKRAALFYLNRVKRGENHWMSLMPYALLSRIWSLCTILLQHTTAWYSCLYSYLNQLEPKGHQFLLEKYELPKNLEELLNLKNLDSFGKLDWNQRENTNIGLSLNDDEEGDSFDNILEYARNINEENLETDNENYSFTQELKTDMSKDQLLQISKVTKTDHGQAISRDSYKDLYISTPQEMTGHEQKIQSVTTVYSGQTISDASCKLLTNFQKKITNDNKGSHYFGSVTNVKSLKDFLDKEEMFRNDGNKQSLTKHLSFMQWHTLKASLLKVCDSILNNRKIERKLQKVWKDKCLDCLCK